MLVSGGVWSDWTSCSGMGVVWSGRETIVSRPQCLHNPCKDAGAVYGGRWSGRCVVIVVSTHLSKCRPAWSGAVMHLASSNCVGIGTGCVDAAGVQRMGVDLNSAARSRHHPPTCSRCC
jgi:hypothetical protein